MFCVKFSTKYDIELKKNNIKGRESFILLTLKKKKNLVDIRYI